MTEILFKAGIDNIELEYAITNDTVTKLGKIYYILNNGVYTQLISGTDYQIGDSIPNNTFYERNLIGLEGTESPTFGSYDRHKFGSNNFGESNILQWANSINSANSWFVKQTIFDTCANTLLQKNGFLKYIDKSFLSVVKDARLTTMACSQEGGDYYTTDANLVMVMTRMFNFHII